MVYIAKIWKGGTNQLTHFQHETTIESNWNTFGMFFGGPNSNMHHLDQRSTELSHRFVSFLRSLSLSLILLIFLLFFFLFVLSLEKFFFPKKKKKVSGVRDGVQKIIKKIEKKKISCGEFGCVSARNVYILYWNTAEVNPNCWPHQFSPRQFTFI